MMEKRKKFEEIREYALQISQKTGEADVASDADDIADICDNALAMPTLNCERFRTWDTADSSPSSANAATIRLRISRLPPTS